MITAPVRYERPPSAVPLFVSIRTGPVIIGRSLAARALGRLCDRAEPGSRGLSQELVAGQTAYGVRSSEKTNPNKARPITRAGDGAGPQVKVRLGARGELIGTLAQTQNMADQDRTGDVTPFDSGR